MSDTRAELEAILAEIETRTAHTEDCHWGQVGPGPALGCLCDRDGRVLREQARTIERMLVAACAAYEPYAPDFDDVAIDAAVRAARSEGERT